MPADTAFLQRNDASRERLRALVARLDDERLGRSLGNGWTVSAALAHLAFWDRRTLRTLEDWRRDGLGASPPLQAADAINERERSAWLAMPAEAAAADALGSAELVDRAIEALPGTLVEEIVASGRMRPLDRSLHRNEHIDEIDLALED